MIRLVTLIVAVLFFSGTAIAAPKHGAYATSSCPYSATAISDGCAAANQNGNFTVLGKFGVNFQTHVQTSGQTWSSAHPWSFNAPGVDYPVGYDKTLTLKNPTVQANLPAGATYTPASDYVYITGTSNVTLNGFDFSVANTDTKTGVAVRNCLSGGATLTISNSYYKLGSAQNTGGSSNPFLSTCTGTTTGPVYILNNEFDGSYYTVGGGTYSYVSGVSGQTNILSFNANSVVDIEYNYAHNTCCQLFNGGGGGNSGGGIYTVSHNYIEAFTLQSPLDLNSYTLLHGAVLENNSGASNIDMGSQYENYNTIVIPSGFGALPITVPFSALNNSNAYNQWMDNLNVSNNVIVINCAVSENPCKYQTNTATFTGAISGTTLTVGTVTSGTVQVNQTLTGSGMAGNCACTVITSNISGSGNGSTWTVSVPQTISSGTTISGSIKDGTISTAITEVFRLSYVSNFTVQNNWVDTHGALSCMSTGGSMSGITGYIDDGLGGGSYDGVPGFILTITGYTNSSTKPVWIFPYQYVTSTGFTPLSVLANPNAGYYVMPYGTGGTTGTGGDGTYMLASDTAGAIATTNPLGLQTANVPIGAASRFGWNISGNTSLIDGTSIYPGGIQWNSTSYGGSCAHTVNNS